MGVKVEGKLFLGQSIGIDVCGRFVGVKVVVCGRFMGVRVGVAWAVYGR